MAEILQQMPTTGTRLDGGLALRISHGNGMVCCGCSRVGMRPARKEIEAVQAAVLRAFEPEIITMEKQPAFKRGADGAEHFIWRIYWPATKVQVVYIRPQQGQLLPDGGA